jgi:hypothetical protein
MPIESSILVTMTYVTDLEWEGVPQFEVVIPVGVRVMLQYRTRG